MKCVVITGSARGLGFEMAKRFRKKNFNVVISDLFKNDIDNAKNKLLDIKSDGDVLSIVCDVTQESDIKKLIKSSKKKFGNIDIWINNAGVNQPDKMIWELSGEEIGKLIDIDLKGTMIASKLIMEVMIKQENGAIYNVEGHGSNDTVIPGLSVYGTAKRGVTYFTNALAKEIENRKVDIMVGKLAPGIMITDFVVNAFRDKKIELSKKNKQVYNILGDYPDVVANFLVNRMISNTDNNVRINWLTNRKAAFRFMSSFIRKRDFFSEKK